MLKHIYKGTKKLTPVYCSLQFALILNSILNNIFYYFCHETKNHTQMATITLGGTPINTIGNLPANGTAAPDFTLVKTDLSTASLSDFKGTRLVLNIFPSIDTSTCATSVRKFNEQASGLENTKVLCISSDLPFAQARFCGAEGLNNVISLSDFQDGSFGRAYGVTFAEGPLRGLHSRAVVVVDENGTVVYSQQVAETKDEPDYEAALESLK
jgi:thioredoxin-dependent peroxiredoxin